MIYPNRKLLPPKNDEHSENEANHVPEKPRDKKPPNRPSTFCPPALYLPPPSQNTHLIPPSVHDGGRSQKLSSLPSFISFTIAFGILLGILAGLIRCCRSNHSRRRTNPTIIPSAQEHRDEGNHQLQLENPIWFINTVGLQQSDINSIAVFHYKKDEGITEGTECSVCLGEFQEDERLRLLPKCNHAFHVACIDTWLRAHKNCPLCRAPIVISSNAGVGSQDNESGQLLRNQNPVASHVNLGSSNDEESIANETSNGHESSENLSSRVSGGKREIVEEHSSSGTSSTSLVHDAADEAQMTQLRNLKPKNSRKRPMRSFSSARRTSQGHMDMKRSSSVNGMFLKEDLNA